MQCWLWERPISTFTWTYRLSNSVNRCIHHCIVGSCQWTKTDQLESDRSVLIQYHRFEQCQSLSISYQLINQESKNQPNTAEITEITTTSRVRCQVVTSSSTIHHSRYHYDLLNSLLVNMTLPTLASQACLILAGSGIPPAKGKNDGGTFACRLEPQQRLSDWWSSDASHCSLAMWTDCQWRVYVYGPSRSSRKFKSLCLIDDLLVNICIF